MQRRHQYWLTGLLALALAACGGGSGGGTASGSGSGGNSGSGNNSGGNNPPPVVATPRLEYIAGSLSGWGTSDGTGALARISSPKSMTTDGAGNIYFIDTNAIRKITPAGAVITVAGSVFESGLVDGSGPAARFTLPSGLAADAAGNIYVTESASQLIRKVDTQGVVSTFAGAARPGGTVNGPLADSGFAAPSAIAITSSGVIYVADIGDNLIRKISGGVVSTFAGGGNAPPGSGDGTGTSAVFITPIGLSVDGQGNLYVLQSNSVIRKVTPGGVVTTLAGDSANTGASNGNVSNGNPANATFTRPGGIASDAAGNVFVADSGNGIIRKIATDGNVTTLAGSPGQFGSANGTGSSARFMYPWSIAVDTAGKLYVGDTGLTKIRKVDTTNTVSDFVGSTLSTAFANGTGTAAGFGLSDGTAVDSQGNIYVSDITNRVIRKVTPDGVATVFAGEVGSSGSADGGPGVARFAAPAGLVFDGAGNLYVADSGNGTIRKIDRDRNVTTVAGDPMNRGDQDGDRVNAQLNTPWGLAMDSSGTLYVTDKQSHTVRRVSTVGSVTTLAGLAGQDGVANGAGTAARFNGPTGIAVDVNGTVYVTDSGNDIIRKITVNGSTGTVTTWAGTAYSTGFANGTGAAARFRNPTSIVRSSDGSFYVADTWNHVIRKITPAAEVSTVVGQAGQATFESGSLPGLVGIPQALAMSGTTLYLQTYSAIAKVTNVP